MPSFHLGRWSLPLALLVASAALADINECQEGSYFIYATECVAPETDSGLCFTRIEQTPPARWCCCENAYDPKDKDESGCAMASAAASTARPFDTLTALRAVRDNVLLRSTRGTTYVRTFYAISTATKNVFAASPALLFGAAMQLDTNLPFFVQWGTTGRASLSLARRNQVSSLLLQIAAAPSASVELKTVITDVRAALTDVPFLQSLGLTLVP
jgi:hypothetical protein